MLSTVGGLEPWEGRYEVVLPSHLVSHPYTARYSNILIRNYMGEMRDAKEEEPSDYNPLWELNNYGFSSLWSWKEKE